MRLDELIALVEPEAGVKPGAGDVEAFEAESGFRLPTALKSLLARTGGGNLERDVVAIWPEQRTVGGLARLHIAQIYGFRLQPWRTVRPLSVHIKEMEVSCEGVPNGIFCFGDDLCGNVVTVDLRDQTFGNVAIVDHEMVGDHFDDEETYRLVATSFQEFLLMLNPSEEDDD